MTDSNNRWDDQELIRRLKAEADSHSASDPAFSATLHERIMQEVKRAAPPQPARGGSVERRPFKFRLAVAALIGVLCAAGSVAVMVSMWSPPPVVVRYIPTPPTPDKPPALADSPAVQDLQQAQFAYLDRDARSLTDYVIEELKFSPAK